MTIDTSSERRSGDRRRDGVTAKILRTVFAMRQGFGNAAARNLLLRNGHDEAFIEQVLAFPGERRGQRRRTDAPVPQPVHTEVPADDVAVTLDASGMAVLHRLRFEADTGMNRMTMADCPAELAQFGLIRQERDGMPTITDKGRQALKHFACVRALDCIARKVDAIPMSDDIRGWLETNLFLHRIGSGYAVTELGQAWLAFNQTISQARPLS